MLNNLKDNFKEVLQATLPIILVVLVLLFVLVQAPLVLVSQFLIGASLVIAGMTLFLFGVRMGLLPMGEAVGAYLPRRNSLWFAMGIAFLVAFAATIAEPDVIVLTQQIDKASQGAISQSLLIYVIAIGVGFFVAVSLLRIIYGFSIKYLLAGSYAIVLVLSFFAPPNFVPVAFDSGGVTTGPMTVPLILSLGIGFSSVLVRRSAINDGFGLIGLASVGPIIGIMVMGILQR
jgi:hypothetical protein